MAITGFVIVWINAFIPKEVPGVTEIITQGENRGKTALPLPAAALIHPFNFLKQRDFTPANAKLGYLTDQREFSFDRGTSVRMQSNAKINLYPPNMVSSDHFTSGTKEVDIVSGKTLGIDFADMSDCFAKGVYKLPLAYLAPGITGGQGINQILGNLVNKSPNFEKNSFNQQFLTNKHAGLSDWYWTKIPKPGESLSMWLNLHGEASDPMVAGAANIDYDVDFVISVDVAKNRLLVGVFGLIDSFPAFEAYANFNGVKKALFQIPPPKGNTPANLIGNPSTRVAAAVSFP